MKRVLFLISGMCSASNTLTEVLLNRLESRKESFVCSVGIRALLICLDAIVISTIKIQMHEPTTGNKFVNTKFFPLSKAAIETFSALPPLALFF